ncbi:hypothetical protein A0O32_2198 [Anoxybacillus flavithermus]|uniref:hypothetical protein n=1 Tax=Anoxybacillus flavithermus TaxID=33934 RepID=UPI0007DF66D9|nr:hypothetical protein [Anoxybacillus flavithermus]OAO78068.1 hypothetical protein A0O32_2198 [Anoxybacillus flavithermus]
MNQPSEHAQRIMIDFFMKTSVPRILAAIERGELTWEEVTGKKEVNNDEKATKCV